MFENMSNPALYNYFATLIASGIMISAAWFLTSPRFLALVIKETSILRNYQFQTKKHQHRIDRAEEYANSLSDWARPVIVSAVSLLCGTLVMSQLK